jgi:uncharacterized DUF497 family protein
MARVEGQEFDWDENNILHLGRHEVSPVEVEQAILDPDAVMLEVQIEGAEDRMKAVGRTSSGRILVAVFTFGVKLSGPSRPMMRQSATRTCT